MRDAHQPQVAVVDIAHGRHASHARLLLQALAQFLDCSNDFHDRH